MTSWKDCTNEEYESVRNSRPYWNCTIWRFIRKLVKRSIEQNLRIKNFEARNRNYERNAVVRNQGTKQRGQRLWDIVGNGKPTGSVLKETVAVSVTISTSVQN